jgi:hypothetical protein
MIYFCLRSDLGVKFFSCEFLFGVPPMGHFDLSVPARRRASKTSGPEPKNVLEMEGRMQHLIITLAILACVVRLMSFSVHGEVYDSKTDWDLQVGGDKNLGFLFQFFSADLG